MHEISFALHGKTFSNKNKSNFVSAPWFDALCRHLKSKFYEAKRLYKSSPTDANKDYFFAQQKIVYIL